ncbi:MAG: diaminopimelate decarboxylase [Dehalococcoidales bacterium]|nr:diaminopimelate decarboxylase [Dehalococcoidales bacterium]MDP7409363.1 diaminopimelate decarboxylase [Dehalococcoidales bacterium]MDP7675698.1 diaminopimelate decarboxylase [Dehalococcoidales bacterium]
MIKTAPRIALFPLTAEVNHQGRLVVGGCDTVELTKQFGTPLYLFDEIGLRRKCAEYKTEFSRRYPDSMVLYAAKAFINKAMALLIKEVGLGLDVVSGGEMGIAHSVDFPLGKAYFHDNNKSAEELSLALEWGVGRIVVDNFHELRMLDKIAEQKGSKPDILLRITPGVNARTHQYTITGNVDSKFGFPLVIGEEAVTIAMSLANLNLIGLHFHIGSLIFEVEPYQQAIEFILNFAAEMRRKHGFELKELDVGGGYAVQYTLDTPAPAVSLFAEAITTNIIRQCQRHEMPLPRLIIEPGRSIVARAGVALYTVGAIKEVPGVRHYVSIDGGMADNIRPALYGAKQEAVLANKMRAKEIGKFTIAGKFCESGDILIRDIALPQPMAGDILAVPGCGAYCLPQASNYNASFKVAVVLVNEGKARLIRRRETLEDLMRCDVV